jgi:hypothetical protein
MIFGKDTYRNPASLAMPPLWASVVTALDAPPQSVGNVRRNEFSPIATLLLALASIVFTQILCGNYAISAAEIVPGVSLKNRGTIREKSATRRVEISDLGGANILAYGSSTQSALAHAREVTRASTPFSFQDLVGMTK